LRRLPLDNEVFTADETFACGHSSETGSVQDGEDLPSFASESKHEGVDLSLGSQNNGHDAAKVVIAANGVATLAGIRLALETAGVEVCAEVRSVEKLVEAVARFEPDVCLLDFDLEGGGIRAAAELTARSSTLPVVFLSAEPSEEEFLEAMRVGAAGYVPHTIVPARLPKVVRAVMNGEPAIPRSYVMPLIDEYRRRPNRRNLVIPNGAGVELTSREWQVLDFVRAGLSTREIAGRLLISEVTVRRHISAVLKKMQVESRAEALKLLRSA
jgi:DNA-binding NarL/FixJ family response regulator